MMHSYINGIRGVILTLSILIIVISLSVYSSKTTPIFSMFAEPQYPGIDDTLHEQTVMFEMILDRRLISTMVAAQASVFCPLFLLLVSRRSRPEGDLSVGSMIEALCQILMPMGLALSWLFSIFFDRKTMVAANGFASLCLYRGGSEWACRAVYAVHGLKHLVILALTVEIGLVCGSLLFANSDHGEIFLHDEEDQLTSGDEKA